MEVRCSQSCAALCGLGAAGGGGSRSAVLVSLCTGAGGGGAAGPSSTGRVGSGVTGRSAAAAKSVVQARTQVPPFARDGNYAREKSGQDPFGYFYTFKA